MFGKTLNERERRLWAATEAIAHGRGGISKVRRETGLNYRTIKRGIEELQSAETLAPGRVRRPGGGVKRAEVRDPGLKPALLALIKPFERGDPETGLRWVSGSAQHIADELGAQGHPVSPDVVERILHEQEFSLQSNRKTVEGVQHPDRDGQFEHIATVTDKALAAGEPVISIDAKKREILGNHKQNGREYRPKCQPRLVDVHDFKDKELGHMIPYGVLDLGRDEGWVSLGVDGNTAGFAVASITSWWEQLGSERYPEATELTITADSGGSNSSTSRLWRVSLQEFADLSGLRVHVLHYPPGTSKWNKIEHRLFSFIARNWKGRPLLDRATVINLVANTKTTSGLNVCARLDVATYPTGIKISDAEIKAINEITDGDDFHPEWNYTVKPRAMRVI